MLKHYYLLEFNERLHDTAAGMSLNDKRTLSIQQQTTWYRGDRYEVGLLWAHDDSRFLTIM